MPRSEYYQDAGNPVQLARLPTTRPLLALRHLDAGWKVQWGSVWRHFLIHQVILIVTVVLTPWKTIQEHPMLPVWVIASAVWILWWTNSIQRETVIVGLLAAVTIALLAIVGPPIIALLALSATASGFLAWQFAQHWIAVCTASPLDRRTAETLKQEWSCPLALSVCVPLAMVVLGWLLGNVLFPAILLLLFATIRVFGFPWGNPLGKLRVFWNALVSWCSYNNDNLTLPGLLPSPAGSTGARVATAALSVILVGSTFTLYLYSDSLAAHATTKVHDSTPIYNVPAVTAGDRSVSSILIPALLLLALGNALLLSTALLLPVALAMPVLIEANRCRRGRVAGENWRTLVNDMQHSPDSTERRSYYMGRVLKDGSPLIVPREVFQEHAHFLGDSGAGKTSLGLNPWIEQTISFGDCSLIVIDLKADTLELLATLTTAAESLQQRTNRRLPIKHFTNQSHLSTFAFNPLAQAFWNAAEPYVKTDFLNGAAGILYGKGYGEGWYTSANAAVSHHVLKKHPDIASCRELAERIRATFASPKKSGLHPSFYNAGAHVQEVFDRLGAFDPINVAPGTGHPDEVVQAAIDLTDVFRNPQILYFHLSSIVAAGSSPEIARFVVYSLLCAASQTERNHPVFLVIDEFQRMVAKNVEALLQLARSMGIGVILANQSMQDLGELIPSIEANCRYRQWFSVSSLDDRERLLKAAGETVEQFTARSWGTSSSGSTSSITISEQVMNRFSVNDIALASDHEKQSIVTITRGKGYAQFGGLPVIITSDFHISQKEYDRRKELPWPAPMTGTYIPREHQQTAPSRKPVTGPVVTTEIISSMPFDGPPPLIAPGEKLPKKPSKKGGAP